MPHEEQREKNIRLVTEKALDCFLENGIEKTKIADIARLSGLTERSVFRYFETIPTIWPEVGSLFAVLSFVEHRAFPF